MRPLPEIRRLLPPDLPAYKSLRDAALGAEPSAFSSDAATSRSEPAEVHTGRLGLDQPHDATFTLGAFEGNHLLGALTLERERRVKVRHVAHLAGMMVSREAQGRGIGRALLEACLATARRVDGLETITLSVTAGNTVAIGLYASAGFVRYGTLPRALAVDGCYHDKDLMHLAL